MSNNTKKSGGLASNPLLTRTEPANAEPNMAPTATEARLPADPPTRPRADTSTSKFTFYFTDEQLDRLDQIWEQIRRANRRGGQRMTKSHVVRVALDRLLDDYDQHPDAVISDLRQQLNR